MIIGREVWEMLEFTSLNMEAVNRGMFQSGRTKGLKQCLDLLQTASVGSEQVANLKTYVIKGSLGIERDKTAQMTDPPKL